MPISKTTRWMLISGALLATSMVALGYKVSLASERLSQQLAAHGISLRYDHLFWSGTGLHMGGVSIISPELKQPLHLDRLILHPDWDRLLTGTLEGKLEGDAEALSFTMNVADERQRIDLQNIALHADLVWLQQQFDIHLPFQLLGGLTVSGHVVLDDASGRPWQGALNTTSDGLQTMFGKASIRIGDYQLELAGSNYRWLWQLNGGQFVVANGSGQLNTELRQPGNWPLSGKLHLTGNGPNGVDYVISGTLAAPRMLSARQ